VAVLVGVPLGLYQYYRAVKKEQHDREYGAYNALDDKYLEFQKMCLEYPHLDVFDIRDPMRVELTEIQRKQELITFTMLFSIFERAYLMYSGQSAAIRQRQWSGWHDYIGDYCGRENFKRAWAVSGNTFDSDFQAYMGQRVRETQSALPSRTEAS
jgi:hypothetical protein